MAARPLKHVIPWLPLILSISRILVRMQWLGEVFDAQKNVDGLYRNGDVQSITHGLLYEI